MYDIITGAQNEEEAYELFIDSKEILRKGGFNLRKFPYTEYLVILRNIKYLLAHVTEESFHMTIFLTTNP